MSVREQQIPCPDGREIHPSENDIKMPLRLHKCILDPELETFLGDWLQKNPNKFLEQQKGKDDIFPVLSHSDK